MRNRELAEVTKADDFIVSDKLISLLMSQVSENKYLMRVFEDLFDADGSEIYLKPAGSYVETGRPVNFYTVVESARRRGEVAIGYPRCPRARGEKIRRQVTPARRDDTSLTRPLIVIAQDRAVVSDCVDEVKSTATAPSPRGGRFNRLPRTGRPCYRWSVGRRPRPAHRPDRAAARSFARYAVALCECRRFADALPSPRSEYISPGAGRAGRRR